MSNTEDLEARVANLEDQVAKLHGRTALAVSDAGAARLLSAAADHDVSVVRDELRAHTKVLNALRETQLEQGLAITGLDQKVTGLDQKVTGLDQKVTGLDQKVTGLEREMREGFAMLGAGIAQITELLTPKSGSEQD